MTTHDREDTNHCRSYGSYCANHQRHVDWAAGEETGFKEDMHGSSTDGEGRVLRDVLVVLSRFRDDQHSAVEFEHVDVMPVEFAEHL